MTDTPTVEQLRSDVFAILRRHDVSEQCFAEVAMVTHAFRTQQPRPDASVEGLRDAIISAYQTGASAVHEHWVAGNYETEPDFYEAASDYADSVDLAALTTREAVVEECAKVCEAQQKVFASPKYTANQPMSSFGERFACGSCAAAIRAIAAKEVE